MDSPGGRLREVPYSVKKRYRIAMMGIGMWELLVIGGIALVFIGPEKFPDFAKIVIRTVRDLRGYVDDVKSEVVSGINPLKKEINKLSRIDPEKYIDALVGGDQTDDDEDDMEEEDEEEEDYGEPEGPMGDPYFEYSPSVDKDNDPVAEETAPKTSEDEVDATDADASENTVGEHNDTGAESNKEDTPDQPV